MTDIRDVLKEMRETASDLSESACEDCMNGCVTWADTIESAMREKNAEIERLNALFEATRFDKKQHAEALDEIERLQLALDDEIARASKAEVASSGEIKRLKAKNARLCRLTEQGPIGS